MFSQPTKIYRAAGTDSVVIETLATNVRSIFAANTLHVNGDLDNNKIYISEEQRVIMELDPADVLDSTGVVYPGSVTDIVLALTSEIHFLGAGGGAPSSPQTLAYDNTTNVLTLSGGGGSVNLTDLQDVYTSGDAVVIVDNSTNEISVDIATLSTLLPDVHVDTINLDSATNVITFTLNDGTTYTVDLSAYDLPDGTVVDTLLRWDGTAWVETGVAATVTASGQANFQDNVDVDGAGNWKGYYLYNTNAAAAERTFAQNTYYDFTSDFSGRLYFRTIPRTSLNNRSGAGASNAMSIGSDDVTVHRFTPATNAFDAAFKVAGGVGIGDNLAVGSLTSTQADPATFGDVRVNLATGILYAASAVTSVDDKLASVAFTAPNEITFTLVSGITIPLDVSSLLNVYTAGNGIDLVGNQFSANIDNNTIVFNGAGEMQVDVSAVIGPDVFLNSSSFDSATGILTLNLSDGSSYNVDLSTFVDVYGAGDGLSQTSIAGTETFSVNVDGTTIKINGSNELFVDLATLPADVHVNGIAFNGATNELEVSLTDGSTFNADFSTLLDDVTITGTGVIDVAKLGNDYTVSITPGTSGQVLTTDGAGVVSWEDLPDDLYISNATLLGGNLLLISRSDGTNFGVDLSTLAADIYIDHTSLSFTYNALGVATSAAIDYNRIGASNFSLSVDRLLTQPQSGIGTTGSRVAGNNAIQYDVNVDNDTIKIDGSNELYVDTSALGIVDNFVNAVSFDSITRDLDIDLTNGTNFNVNIADTHVNGVTFNGGTNDLTVSLNDGSDYTVNIPSGGSTLPNGVNSGDILSWDVFGNTWQVNGNVQIEATGVIEYSTSARINLQKNWLHNSWTTLGNHQVDGDIIAQADILAGFIPSYATGAEPPSREEVRIDTITGQLYRTPIVPVATEKGNTAHVVQSGFKGGVASIATPLTFVGFTSATYADPTGNMTLDFSTGEISNNTGADIRVKLDFSFLAGSGTTSQTQIQVTDGATTQDLGYFVANGTDMISMQTVMEIPAFGKLIILIQNGDPFPSAYEFTGTFTVEQLSI